MHATLLGPLPLSIVRLTSKIWHCFTNKFGPNILFSAGGEYGFMPQTRNQTLHEERQLYWDNSITMDQAAENFLAKQDLVQGIVERMQQEASRMHNVQISFDSVVLCIRHCKRPLTTTMSIDDNSYHTSEEETMLERQEANRALVDALYKEITKVRPLPRFKISYLEACKEKKLSMPTMSPISIHLLLRLDNVLNYHLFFATFKESTLRWFSCLPMDILHWVQKDAYHSICQCAKASKECLSSTAYAIRTREVIEKLYHLLLDRDAKNKSLIILEKEIMLSTSWEMAIIN